MKPRTVIITIEASTNLSLATLKEGVREMFEAEDAFLAAGETIKVQQVSVNVAQPTKEK